MNITEAVGIYRSVWFSVFVNKAARRSATIQNWEWKLVYGQNKEKLWSMEENNGKLYDEAIGPSCLNLIQIGLETVSEAQKWKI